MKNSKFKKNKQLVGVLVVLFCILLFCARITGVHLHMVLGCVFFIGAILHCYKYTSTHKGQKNVVKITQIVLTISVVMVTISGILLRVYLDSILILVVHKLTSVIMVILLIAHILQYRKRRRL